MSPRTNRIFTDGAAIAGAIAASFVVAGFLKDILPADTQPRTVLLIGAALIAIVAILVVAARMKFGAAGAFAARLLLLTLLIALIGEPLQMLTDVIVVDGPGFLWKGGVGAYIFFAVAVAAIGLLLLAVLYIMRWRPRMLLLAVPALLIYLPFLSFDGPWVYSLCGDSRPHRLYAPPSPPAAVTEPASITADALPYPGCGAPAVAKGG